MKGKLWWLVVVALAVGVLVWHHCWTPQAQHRVTQAAQHQPPRQLPAPATNKVAATAQDAQIAPQKPQPQPRQPRSLLPVNPQVPMAVICGQVEGQRDYNTRALALRQLTRELHSNDVQVLRQFLDVRARDQSDMNERQFNSIKNEVLDALVRQDQMPEKLGMDLVRMYRDEKNDDVWRDYCLQFMTTYWNRMQVMPENTNWTAERPELIKAYWDAISEKQGGIAGTALIGLELLSQKAPEFNRQEVEQAAVTLASDEACGPATRLTALRLCGQLGRQEALAPARVLAQTADNVPLQMAAIATVGDLGGVQDAELLASLAGSTDKRIQTVAAAAQKKLAARLQK